MKIDFLGPNTDFFKQSLLGPDDLEIVVVGNEFTSIVIFSLPDSDFFVSGIGTDLVFDKKGMLTDGNLSGLSFFGPGGIEALFSGIDWDISDFLAAIAAAKDGFDLELLALMGREPIEIDATLASVGFDTGDFALPYGAAVDFKGSVYADTITSGSQMDQLSGGLGDDELIAGFGDDTVFGGLGDDLIFGQFGYISISTRRSPVLKTDDDLLVGGLGDDQIFGGDGADLIYGDTKDRKFDVIPAVIIDDPGGDDKLYGDGDDDEIYGGGGNDIIFGGNGNDLLYGGIGANTLYGDNGDDRIYGGGDRFGIIPYETTATDKSILPPAFFGNQIFGGAGDDWILAGNGNDRVFGGTGNDRIFGGAGEDKIRGGSGDDRITGGSGFDVIYGGGGNDRIFGGNDEPIYWILADKAPDIYPLSGLGNLLFGGGGRDRIVGGYLDDLIVGGRGRDVLIAGAGNDRLFGGGGADVFVFDADANEGRNVIVDFSDGQDLLRMSGDIFASITSVYASGIGGVNTTVTLAGGTEIILKGVDVSLIGVDDFDFI